MATDVYLSNRTATEIDDAIGYLTLVADSLEKIFLAYDSGFELDLGEELLCNEMRTLLQRLTILLAKLEKIKEEKTT